MKKGDRVFFYHTGKEKAIVGEMVVSADAKPDPKDDSAVVVGVRPVRKLANPVTLAQMLLRAHRCCGASRARGDYLRAK